MELTVAYRRPASDEYPPFFKNYVDTADTDDILALLAHQESVELEFLRSIKWEKWETAYAPDKWTLAELVLHTIDTERVFAYRALRISRGDQTPLPSFDHDSYVPNSGAATRTPASIVDEWLAVRQATLHLFNNMTDEMWDRRGTASGAEISVRALAYIIAGHMAHHMRIIRERYLE